MLDFAHEQRDVGRRKSIKIHKRRFLVLENDRTATPQWRVIAR